MSSSLIAPLALAGGGVTGAPFTKNGPPISIVPLSWSLNSLSSRAVPLTFSVVPAASVAFCM